MRPRWGDVAIVERLFRSDHAAAEGHFPGNPIIPGAVLLSEILNAIEADLGVTLFPCQIEAAKFFLPVRPGARVVIEFTGSVPGAIKFACAVEAKTVLTGRIKCDATPTST